MLLKMHSRSRLSTLITSLLAVSMTYTNYASAKETSKTDAPVTTEKTCTSCEKEKNDAAIAAVPPAPSSPEKTQAPTPVANEKEKKTAKIATLAPSSSGNCGCTPAEISKPFTAVAKKASPAVVFIKVESSGADLDEGFPDGGSPNPYDNFGDDFLRRFFGAPPRGQQKPVPQTSQGSGFLVSGDGYIMTNAHVIAGSDKITVTLHDGRELDATVIGSDPHTDVAVIKIEGKGYPFVEFGNSDNIEIGEWAIAIGSPFQLQASLTVGVISAKGRQNLRITDLEDFIQTDAAINPGNSGGPLFNLNCQVIGINTAIVSRSGGYMGIGFAIPSNMAKNIMTQLIDKGAVTRGFLGVSLQPVDKDIAEAFNLEKVEGALVSEVVKDSPADKGGLKQGDIILEYNNTPIKSLGGFRNDISLMDPGSTVTMKVNRKGKIVMLKIQLGKASDSRSAGGIMQQIGFEVSSLTPDLAKQLGYDSSIKGVVITKIKPGSPAAQAGMRPGFVIKEINDVEVTSIEEFNKVLDELGKKKTIKLLVKQGNADRYYSIKLN